MALSRQSQTAGPLWRGRDAEELFGGVLLREANGTVTVDRPTRDNSTGGAIQHGAEDRIRHAPRLDRTAIGLSGFAMLSIRRTARRNGERFPYAGMRTAYGQL